MISVKHYFKKVLLMFTGLLLFGVFNLMAQNSCKQCHLFTINRNRDADIIHYEIKTDKKGHLDTKNPINIHWERRTQHNQIEPLSWIQNKYAYGIHIINSNSNEVVFQFVSYAHRTFTLKKDNGKSYKVFTQFDNQEVEVQEINIQFNGGTFWFPIISTVELRGIQANTDELVSETITP